MKIPFFHSKNKAGHGILNFRTPLFHGHHDQAVLCYPENRRRLIFILLLVPVFNRRLKPLQNGFQIIKKLRV
ncbi:hypothetical protein AB434_3288 [Heyndrickxia coagulans]|uniref:Uncharacterized protein n=1 Tax=Heyndrickxia coagulans TaxID=1398 RepID=A0AAN0T4P1_HEYCO|nr:hypothetical protein SB48_HM08orf03167 [Heyndrickxia coagulans]AKN55693.1 hypothetical protein AB434_3288 [Heyndrickxia coagulans]KYC63961.1 hypothetical protein B4100_3095 [Heyndrickxia coagulans]